MLRSSFGVVSKLRFKMPLNIYGQIPSCKVGIRVIFEINLNIEPQAKNNKKILNYKKLYLTCNGG